MRLRLSIGRGAALLLAGCVALSAFPAMAEPILGVDSLEGTPAGTAQDKTVTDAMASFKVHDFDGALRLWREAVRKDPDLPPAQAIMGQLFLRANMPEEARQALEQSIAETPDDPEPYLVMALVHLRQREFDQAESMLQKAEALLPAFDKSAKRKELLQTQLLGSRANLAETREDWAGAERLYASMVESNPKNVAALTRRAYCLFRQDRIDDALKQLRAISEATPNALTPEAVMVQFCDQVGDREKADQWMVEAVKAAPQNFGTQLLAGQRALRAQRFSEAREHAAAATKINSKAIEAITLQGMIAMLEKNYMAAELFFDAALRQSPNDLGIRNNLALALIEQNDEAKGRRALELAETNAKQHPDVPQIASTYGHVLYRLGRFDDAEKALRVAAPIVGEDVDTAYVLACLAAERGRKDEARQLLENGLKSENMALFHQEAEALLEKLNKEK